MILQHWLQELRGAMSEQDVVSFARAKLARAQSTRVPPAIAAHRLETGDDVREVAASLAALPPATGHDAELLQQLLIVFSLAADRLSDLERRGMAARGGRSLTPAG
ncbi:MAG TPA: hypothetical protein VFE23_21365 [Usitatibacter sp.]|jgi:hypothetical protein|nr:hypothetical protein [Usitatibacter sp.]